VGFSDLAGAEATKDPIVQLLLAILIPKVYEIKFNHNSQIHNYNHNHSNKNIITTKNRERITKI
jgi:hypothetical protein